MRLTASRIARGLWWLLAGRPDQRRRVRHELAGRAARLFGDSPIGDDHTLWRRDEEFSADFKRLVFEGASAYFLARARPDAVVHLFDRFEGLPLPGPEDAVGDREVFRWQPGDFRARFDALNRNLAGLDNVRVHRGDIPQVLQSVAEERFCLVHIDVDLYRPTLESLRFFYPRMVPGG